jgi:hypothetical protein
MTHLSRHGLRQMIIEACGEPHSSSAPACPTCGAAVGPVDTARASVKRDDPGRVMGHGGRSRMAREQLYKIAEYADDLWNLLADDDELPEWVQSKIAVMADNVGEVKHHVEYKTVKGASHG